MTNISDEKIFIVRELFVEDDADEIYQQFLIVDFIWSSNDIAESQIVHFVTEKVFEFSIGELASV